MKNILVISGHPELNHSVANATILDEVATAPMLKFVVWTGSIRTANSISLRSRKACSGPM
jgi:hypothetical protein